MRSFKSKMGCQTCQIVLFLFLFCDADYFVQNWSFFLVAFQWTENVNNFAKSDKSDNFISILINVRKKIFEAIEF